VFALAIGVWVIAESCENLPFVGDRKSMCFGANSGGHIDIPASEFLRRNIHFDPEAGEK
jgi:hypothetical protein